MALWARFSQSVAAAPAGILASRRRAEPALLRIFSRARRQASPLLLLRLAPSPNAARAPQQPFLSELAAELRLTDLCWLEPGGVVVALLEAAGAVAPVLERLERQARRAGVRPHWGVARFPDQGLTLDALLAAAAAPPAGAREAAR